MTVGFVVLFFKCSFVQLFQAESADKMFRVEFPEHGGDTTSRDWFVASCAQRASLQVIVSLTVRLAFVVEEGASNERLSAILKA